MLRNKKKRSTEDINAGSMADIAFLLLIFFLVTTTISAEKGIMARLPPYMEIPPPPVPRNNSNVLSVKINMNDALLVEKEEMDITELRSMTKRFLLNNGVDSNLSETPKKAIVSIINDRATSYNAYLSAYNEVIAAYNEIWEAESQTRFNVSYKVLEKEQKKSIQWDYPLVISEAEPNNFK